MADSALPKRRPNGTILPGSTLNPSGRPRIVQEIQDMARSAAPAAFARVVALANSPDERVALAASQEILNRAYGKPLQQVNSDVRKLDVGQMWLAGMQALHKRETEAEPAAILESTALSIRDVPATEPAPDYTESEAPDREPVEW